MYLKKRLSLLHQFHVLTSLFHNYLKLMKPKLVKEAMVFQEDRGKE